MAKQKLDGQLFWLDGEHYVLEEASPKEIARDHEKRGVPLGVGCTGSCTS